MRLAERVQAVASSLDDVGSAIDTKRLLTALSSVRRAAGEIWCWHAERKREREGGRERYDVIHAW